MFRYDLVIINRSFWPNYPVIGEGLLRVAESLASHKKVSVILQDQNNINKNLKKYNRGINVDFFPIKAFSNSSSNLIKRFLDSIMFMFWVVFSLIRTRPKLVYVSTDPPILIPFIVALLSKIMKFKFIYHLQDIHPEASVVIIKINKYLLSLLKTIDNFSLKQATLIITLNQTMKKEILKRSNIQKEIVIIENPSIPLDINNSQKKAGFVFAGNLGRLQRIPLLIDSIKEYQKKGGSLEFAFLGGGIFKDKISELSKNSALVKYYGLVDSKKVGFISNKYEWALTPIEDAVTYYSFPSKISSYVCIGAKILAICGEDTAVADWVISHKVGIVVKPKVNDLVNIFFKIENNDINTSYLNLNQDKLKKILNMNNFVKNINSKISFFYNE